MATRKQKHAAAVAKREQYMAAYRADGLRALELDQENRAKKKLAAWSDGEEARKANSRLQKRDPEITVGEFLEKVNSLSPLFSEK